jgi:hypothetical protein
MSGGRALVVSRMLPRSPPDQSPRRASTSDFTVFPARILDKRGSCDVLSRYNRQFRPGLSTDRNPAGSPAAGFTPGLSFRSWLRRSYSAVRSHRSHAALSWRRHSVRVSRSPSRHQVALSSFGPPGRRLTHCVRPPPRRSVTLPGTRLALLAGWPVRGSHQVRASRRSSHPVTRRSVPAPAPRVPRRRRGPRPPRTTRPPCTRTGRAARSHSRGSRGPPRRPGARSRRRPGARSR